MFLSKRKSKKASVEGRIIKLLLLIVSFIIIFGFIYKFYAKATKFAGEEACHDAIVLTQVLAEKVPTGEYSKPWPATCKTQDKVIETKDPEKAKKELAELMSWCWWMMGEGVIKPFDRDWFTSERKCFVCYTAKFPDLEEQINQQDFMFFLQDKGKKGTTYYNYLKYESNPVMKTAVIDPVDKNRIYAVIYMSPSDAAFAGIATCLVEYTALGAAVGAGALGVGAIPSAGVGAAIGSVRCGAALVAQLLDSFKDDVVYVTDVNRGISGCAGGWFVGTDVKTA